MRTRIPKNIPLVVISILLISCAAKKAPERLTVIAPETFAGTIKLTACDSQAPSDHIVLDTSGRGKTSMCSASSDLRIIVIRGQQSLQLPAQIAKTGDAFVVTISVDVPSRTTTP